ACRWGRITLGGLRPSKPPMGFIDSLGGACAASAAIFNDIKSFRLTKEKESHKMNIVHFGVMMEGGKV
ncbi:MAG: hypothetical protein Q4C35_12650, partial [Eubacteriales bacterium]|nr:hypothetical protein [Eubacteriales bacterium]